jgi:hypothetical protein
MTMPTGQRTQPRPGRVPGEDDLDDEQQQQQPSPEPTPAPAPAPVPPTPPESATSLTAEQIAWVARQILPPPENAPEVRTNTKWPRAKALAFLESCPMVPVFVQLGIGELGQPGPFFTSVVWNGWEWRFRKGRQEVVPEPIAAIIYETQEPARTKQYRDQETWSCLISGQPLLVRGEAFGGRRILAE